jgi:hypothetical protein
MLQDSMGPGFDISGSVGELVRRAGPGTCSAHQAQDTLNMMVTLQFTTTTACDYARTGRSVTAQTILPTPDPTTFASVVQFVYIIRMTVVEASVCEMSTND